MSEELIPILENMICKEMRFSNNGFTNVKTIQFRILIQIAKMLGIKLEEIYDLKNCLYTHKQCLERVIELWNFETNNEETQIIEAFLSKDYSPRHEIVNILHIFLKYSREYNKINQLFAIDGLKGKEPENYIENLKYPFYGEGTTNPKEIHIRAIRFMYSTLPSFENSHEIIYSTLYHLFKDVGVELTEKPTFEFETCKTLAETYKSFIGENIWTEIVKMNSNNTL